MGGNGTISTTKRQMIGINHIVEERMKIKTLALLLLSVILLSSCAAARNQTSTDNFAGSAPAPMAPAMERASLPEAPMEDKSFSESGAVGGIVTDRLVIKNGTISIIVVDPGKSMETIAAMADEMGGWVVSSNLYKIQTSEGVEIPQANINIRVPEAKLNEALTKIKAEVKNLATDIRSENVSGQDVTAEYTDLTSRRNNLERAEAQLQEIMASATKTEDVLNVFNQLTQIRGEIEVIKGQMKYYEESSNFSAINVELISQESIKPITVAGWQPQGVARDAVQALINTFKTLVNILIYLVILVLPILLVLYGVVRLLIWLFKLLFLRKKPKKVNDIVTNIETK